MSAWCSGPAQTTRTADAALSAGGAGIIRVRSGEARTAARAIRAGWSNQQARVSASPAGASGSACAPLRGVGLERYVGECHAGARAYEQATAEPRTATTRLLAGLALRDSIFDCQTFDRDLAAEHGKPTVDTGAIERIAGAVDRQINVGRKTDRVDAVRLTGLSFNNVAAKLDRIVTRRALLFDTGNGVVEFGLIVDNEGCRNGGVGDCYARGAVPKGLKLNWVSAASPLRVRFAFPPLAKLTVSVVPSKL